MKIVARLGKKRGDTVKYAARVVDERRKKMQAQQHEEEKQQLQIEGCREKIQLSEDKKTRCGRQTCRTREAEASELPRWSVVEGTRLKSGVVAGNKENCFAQRQVADDED